MARFKQLFRSLDDKISLVRALQMSEKSPKLQKHLETSFIQFHTFQIQLRHVCCSVSICPHTFKTSELSQRKHFCFLSLISTTNSDSVQALVKQTNYIYFLWLTNQHPPPHRYVSSFFSSVLIRTLRPAYEGFRKA